MVSMQTAHYSLAYYSILLFSHHFGIKRSSCSCWHMYVSQLTLKEIKLNWQKIKALLFNNARERDHILKHNGLTYPQNGLAKSQINVFLGARLGRQRFLLFT